MKTKNKVFILIPLLFLFFSVDAFAQKDLVDGYIISSGIGKFPGYFKTIKALHIFNGVVIRDSVDCVKLIEESKNFKVKIKKKDIPKNLYQIFELSDEFYYVFKFFEIKDVIIDLERMRLIKIK